MATVQEVLIAILNMPEIRDNADISQLQDMVLNLEATGADLSEYEAETISLSAEDTASIHSLGEEGITLHAHGLGASVNLKGDILNIDNTTVAFDSSAVGFYGVEPAVKPTGVAVTAGGIHAALVTLGLIEA